MADAIVHWLIAQRTVLDDQEVPLFPGVFAIFGHGNVTCLGHALQQAGDALPTWRGQNEGGMALAAIGYAKAARRRTRKATGTRPSPRGRCPLPLPERLAKRSASRRRVRPASSPDSSS